MLSLPLTSPAGSNKSANLIDHTKEEYNVISPSLLENRKEHTSTNEPLLLRQRQQHRINTPK